MYKQDLALNNLQWLICPKTQPCQIIYTGCVTIQGTHVTANNSSNNKIVFFFVSDLKIVYNNNY